MKNIKVKILGTELEANLLNPDVMAKYESGYAFTMKKYQDARSCETGSEGIRMQCEATIGFIEDLFGHGSAKKVFGEEIDLLSALEAMEELSEMYEKQVNPLITERSEIVASKLKTIKK